MTTSTTTTGTTSVYLNQGKPATTLAAGALAADTTLTVASTVGFAPNGGTLLIGTEQIHYGTRSPRPRARSRPTPSPG